MNESSGGTGAPERKILAFTLDDQAFGIDTASLIEIREWVSPTAMPKMPDYMCGVISLRGTPIPIIDLSERLGRAPTCLHSQSCVIIVRLRGQAAGFLVNRIIDIVEIDAGEIQPAPEVEGDEAGAVTGLLRKSALGRGLGAGGTSEMVSLLDLEALNIMVAPELRPAAASAAA